MDIFISYQNDSKDTVEDIVNYLEENGRKCWMAPRDVMMSYAGDIVDAISSCKVFLLFLTQKSCYSVHVLNEIEQVYKYFKEGKTVIIPVQLENCEYSKDIDYYISRIQRIDAYSLPLTEAKAEILKKIDKCLGVSTVKKGIDYDHLKALILLDNFDEAVLETSNLIQEYPLDELLWKLYLEATLGGKQERTDEAYKIYLKLLKISTNKDEIKKEYAYLEEPVKVKAPTPVVKATPVDTKKSTIANKVEVKKPKEETESEGFPDTFKLGNSIKLGKYDNIDMRWRIMDVKDNKALVVCNKIIESRRFDPNKKNYKSSEIREWLNKDFFNQSFTEEEKKHILVTDVDNSILSTLDEKNKFVCGNTQDKIFLLSKREVLQYYRKDESRVCTGTVGAKNRGLFLHPVKLSSFWWLRTPTSDVNANVWDVSPTGELTDNVVYNASRGVRPACWVSTVEIKDDKQKSKPTAKKSNTTAKVATSKGTIKASDNEVKGYEPIPNVGDVIKFGKYSGAIVYWKVLQIRLGKMLLITDKIIESRQYDKASNNYKDSAIRTWLNNSFYNRVFSDEEREKILLTSVDNSLDSTEDRYNKYVCENTKDYVFLLSVKEANRFFKSDELRASAGTTHAKNGDIHENRQGNTSWWLRTPAFFKADTAKFVAPKGAILSNVVSETTNGVRPAIWVKIDNNK